MIGICDVRDVAQAHVLAMTTPIAAGKRFLIQSKESISLLEICKCLSDEFDPLGYNIPTSRLPYAMLYLGSFFDSSLKGTLTKVDNVRTYDTSNTDNILKLKLRPLDETVRDMGHSLIKLGLVPATAKYSEKFASKL